MTWARPAGDAALLIDTVLMAGGAGGSAADSGAADSSTADSGSAGQLAAEILARHWPGVIDAVPGARTVLVRTEPGSWDLGELADRIATLPRRGAGAGRGPVTEIEVCYDGQDLAEVARLTGLSVADVVTRHAGAEYSVGWLGFSPGFAYLTGLDPALCTVSRLSAPRLWAPAGSVAIAGGLSAVYPSASPGGWRLLGRTAARLWDPSRDPPALLTPGARVRFRPVASLPQEPSPRNSRPPADRAASGFAGRAGRSLEVIRPGPLATVQDLGRAALGHLGVRGCGAADAASLRLANQLAGNAAGAAGIEITLGRAAFRCPAGCWLAVTGARTELTVTQQPGGPAVTAPFGAAFWLAAGGELRLGPATEGLRSYLAVRGGIDVPMVLGSRSTDLTSGLGPPALRPGDVLPIGDADPPPPQSAPPQPQSSEVAPAGAGADPAGSGTPRPPDHSPASPAPDRGAGRDPVLLRVIPGPQDDWFAPGTLELLCGTDGGADTAWTGDRSAGSGAAGGSGAGYTVSADSDRTGLRLDGPVLPRAEWARDAELPSEGMVPGALQVPADGRPILLLADCPVTGGYPVIAVVHSADLGLAAQLRPGQRIRFALSRC